MKVFWEDDLVYDTKDRHGKLKKLIFKENLEIYRYNQVLKGEKFFNVFARSDKDNLIYSMTNEDGSIEWRQIDGIRTKEEFILLITFYFSSVKKKNWRAIQYNVPHIMYKYLLNKLTAEGILKARKNGTPYFEGVYYNTWHGNEQLYNALVSGYKAGYTFNECNSTKIYSNVIIQDFKAFHEALLYYMDFPKKFIKVQTDYDLARLGHYYGKFSILVQRDDPYLRNFGKLYNSTQKKLSGWFNDIDLDFIERLAGTKYKKVEYLYKVEMGRLPKSVLDSLLICFTWRESTSGLEKDLLKQGYEKFCGQAGRRRFYEFRLIYDEEKQTFYDNRGSKLKQKNEFSFEQMDKNLDNHGLDLSWNVWVNSYARQILLILKQKYGGIYGDTDSIMRENGEPIDFYFNEEHKRNCEKGFILGKLEVKGVAEQFKAINFKQYAWTENGVTTVKMSGADNDIVKNYIGTDLTKFNTNFPAGVNPYVYTRINAKGEKERAWRGSASIDRTLTNDKRVIISCAGSGKTTTLIEAVKQKFKQTNDLICVIAFTNKNVSELRERIGIMSDRLEIRTLDSLAASYLNNSIEGDKFDSKLKAATELLLSGYNAVPVHLFVDEFQDLDLTKFNFINAIPCISRFYIGDPNQSIYGYSGAMNLFDKLVDFKVEKRIINYRCCQAINDYGEGFLLEEKRPHAKSCNDNDGEVMWSTEIPDDDSIILCRTNDQLEQLEEKYPNRIIMTIHKSKGLTFNNVAVVGLDKRNDGEEANIAYVAATRAKEKLTIVLEG